MSDSQVPVERGLRATVRMAAGINIGEEASRSPADVLGALIRRLVPPAPVAGLLSAKLTTITTSTASMLRMPVVRHGLAGAGVGAVVVGALFVAMAAEAALTVGDAPAEVALALVEPAPAEPMAVKGDRLTTAAVAAAATTIEYDPASPADMVITTRAPKRDGTVAMPVLAYASPPKANDATTAIDGILDTPPIAAMRPAKLTDEEDDDESVVPLVLPIPRARPDHQEVAKLPMPRPRPTVLASLTTRGITPPGLESEQDGAPEPAKRTPTNALGFFSSPSDPVRPPSKTTVETPFGVPYVLQTGSVETACLKPELVDILRKIEGHYHQKVVITSGFRDRGRQGSLHRQCAAADIQVAGVDASSLASYARTIPAIGGVGTYCHPSMIHVDIGTPRDWKYGCGSFFAMRGGSAHWGRVPGSLAKAQASNGAANQTED